MVDPQESMRLLMAEVDGLERRVAATGKKPSKDISEQGSETAFQLIEGMAQWRYENPLLAKVANAFVGLSLLFALLITLWWIGGTGVGEATGLAGVRDRVTYAYYGFVWATRGESLDPSDFPITPTRMAGSIQQIAGDILVVDCYEKGKATRRLVKLANVIVGGNRKAFGQWANQYLLKGVMLDFYRPLEKIKGYDVWAVVVWHQKTPLNVQPVELGIAVPEKNPPTSVVNQIFSQYYWSLAKG